MQIGFFATVREKDRDNNAYSCDNRYLREIGFEVKHKATEVRGNKRSGLPVKYFEAVESRVAHAMSIDEYPCQRSESQTVVVSWPLLINNLDSIESLGIDEAKFSYERIRIHRRDRRTGSLGPVRTRMPHVHSRRVHNTTPYPSQAPRCGT